MRLAGIVKGGFYPLPDQMTERIISSINKGDSDRPQKILDPAAGEGVALIEISEALNLEAYGCELNDDRAAIARETIDPIRLINDDYRNIKTPKAAFSVLYLNPPYDFDKESGRVEYTWLKKLRPHLAPGGILIWVVPERILQDKLCQRYIASWFDNIVAYRFYGESYNAYKQVVIYGVHRKKAEKVSPDQAQAIRQVASLGENLPQHPIFETPLYTLEGIEEESDFYFFGLTPDPEAIKSEVKKYGVKQKESYQRFLSAAPKVNLNPLTPMKIGHMASIISAGHINNTTLETSEGKVLIKGSVYKEQVSNVSHEEDEKKSKIKVTTIHDPRALIVKMDEDGKVNLLQNDKLATFLQENINPITKKIKEVYPPRYEFVVEERYRKALVAVNPRRIPNTNRKGLLPAQKHAAIALLVQHETHHDAILIGQLGTGKTIIAIANAYARHRLYGDDHFVVMCPPHLVEKWIREVGLTWPNAYGMELASISDIDRFFETEGPIFGILKSTKASLSDGWRHTIDFMGPCTLSPTNTFKDPPQLETGSELLMTTLSEIDDAPEGSKERLQLFKRISRNPITCPTCGSPILVPDPKHKGGKLPATLDDFKKRKLDCWKCNAPLWQDHKRTELGRYPLATYIKRHYAGRIDLAIVDEAHQYKGVDAERGFAYARIVRAARKTIAMTGTIYGGKASTLFFLLFRLSDEFTRSWVDESRSKHNRMMATEWAEEYGVVEEIVTHTEYHSKTGSRQSNRTTREVAGSSPAMLPWLLNRSVFVSLADMGMALPNFSEHVVEVEMDEEMAEQYDYLHDELQAELAKRLVRGDRSMLGKYIAALLYWPDSPWRPKVVELPHAEGEEPKTISIPGTQQPLGVAPKEAAILKLVQSELAEGRNCLLMVAQTNTLDIQPQWKQFLKQNGIKASILRGSPYGREEWLHKQVSKGVKVIISHPRKVETGLDILDYPTIIWMCPEFSIYTVIQASGRAFRLGQTRDCKVYHFVYGDTIQGDALSLVIAKAAAAKRVNGDTIESDDLADLDNLARDSIENALAKLLTEKASVSTKLTELDIEFEQVKDDVYVGKFADCNTKEEAQALYEELTKEIKSEMSDTKSVGSLNELYAKVNKEFTVESTYLSESSITDDDEPEFIEEAEEEEQPPGVLEVARRMGKIAKEPEEPEEEAVQEEPETIEVTPKPTERPVFGKTRITIQKRKKAVKVSNAQLSLF